LISLEAVSRVFGDGPGRVVALDGIDLQVGPGEFVAVAGPSGSGKTSLLNLIGVLDAPTSGRILIDGQDVARLSEARQAELRLAGIGFVFQRFNLIPVLSAAENVELPLLFRPGIDAAQRRERVHQALERVGLADRGRRRPAQLSGGEQQRVAVARALAARPRVVLADEPTANLDHETGTPVIQLMHELNREEGATFLYATHDPELIRLADRVVRLRDGRLAGEDA
jgi:putative ABC transport system ATP-binding protein